MNSLRKYSMILASVTLVSALAACGNDTDVPPGNTSNALGDNEPAVGTDVANDIARSPEGGAQMPATQPGGAGNLAQADAGAATVQVTEADIIPTEFLRDGASPPARMAMVTLQPTQGNNVSGMVAFIQEDADAGRIRVVGKLVGIPAGEHGFHIHEFGDCTAPDAASAGEHYNPDGTMHGGPEAPVRHLGDFGNLVAAADQTATFDFYDENISLGGMNSVVSKAFIVHANADDLETQPSGNSGARVACGVIGNQEFNTTPDLSGRGDR